MTYLGSVTGGTGQGPALVSLTLPSFPNPLGGQVLILAAFADASVGLTPTIPAGFTQVGPTLNGSASETFFLCKKLGTAADSGTTIQGGFNTTWYQTGVARVYDGIGDVDQNNNAGTNSSTNIGVAALATLQVPGELIIAFYGGRGGGTTAFGAPSGWTNEVDAPSSARIGIGSSDTTQPGTSQPAATATNAAGGNWSSFTVSAPQMVAARQLRVQGAWVNKPLLARQSGAWV